jgi:hypothetical protein
MQTPKRVTHIVRNAIPPTAPPTIPPTETAEGRNKYVHRESEDLLNYRMANLNTSSKGILSS